MAATIEQLEQRLAHLERKLSDDLNALPDIGIGNMRLLGGKQVASPVWNLTNSAYQPWGTADLTKVTVDLVDPGTQLFAWFKVAGYLSSGTNTRVEIGMRVDGADQAPVSAFLLTHPGAHSAHSAHTAHDAEGPISHSGSFSHADHGQHTVHGGHGGHEAHRSGDFGGTSTWDLEHGGTRTGGVSYHEHSDEGHIHDEHGFGDHDVTVVNHSGHNSHDYIDTVVGHDGHTNHTAHTISAHNIPTHGVHDPHTDHAIAHLAHAGFLVVSGIKPGRRTVELVARRITAGTFSTTVDDTVSMLVFEIPGGITLA